MVDRGSGRHTYQVIAWEIRDKINRGELEPGDAIPSLPTIRDDYRVSYQTAQAAVTLLKVWGLVRSDVGRGTFVLEIRPVTEILGSPADPGTSYAHGGTWREVVAGYGMTGTQRVTDAGRTATPIDVADAFGLEAETTITWRQRIMLVDDDPVQIATSYYPDDIAEAIPALAQPDRLPSSAPQLMARAGWVITSGQDLVTAKPAAEDEAAMLAVEVGTPVAQVLRVAQAADGRVIMVERMVSDSMRLRQAWNF
jgi:GntR family transcriptional regulator